MRRLPDAYDALAGGRMKRAATQAKQDP